MSSFVRRRRPTINHDTESRSEYGVRESEKNESFANNDAKTPGLKEFPQGDLIGNRENEDIQSPWFAFSPPLSFKYAKWLILRTIGTIYFFAFLGAWNQNLGLMGRYGLVPAEDHWRKILQGNQKKSPWSGFLKHPSIFWWIPMNDATLLTLFGSGVFISSLVAFLGINSWLLQSILWLLYFSVVTTAEGTTFYAYGWESQLLETGFLTIFICALPHVYAGRFHPCIWESSPKKHEPNKSPSTQQLEPSFLILWLFRWLCFRISIGAGLIKIRGSSCWDDKTCLHYHFETQPIPSPLSFFYHFLPRWVQSQMVDIDLIVQLYTSFFVLLPTWIPYSMVGTRICRFIVRLGGCMQIGFMVGIILSGNFAFLNHLTIVPALACLDDACWRPLLFLITPPGSHNQATVGRRVILSRNILDVLLVLYIGYLSSPVVSNLLQKDGKHQLMNASFDPFRLVNTYGAFGSVGQRRYEPIIMISDDGENWVELEFPCKPGSTTRRPCFCAPYHYRADWNIWFLGFKPHKMYLNRREFWLYNLLQKILEDKNQEPAEGTMKNVKLQRPWLDLLDSLSSAMLMSKYYQRRQTPIFAKVEMYHYQMAGSLMHLLSQQWAISSTRNKEGDEIEWWIREFEETLIPPVTFLNGKLGYAPGFS